MIQVLTKEAFESEVRRDPGTVVLDVFGATCPPCRVVHMALTEMEPAYPAVKWVRLEASLRLLLVVDALGITGVPTVVVFRGGKEVGRIAGYSGSFDEYKQALAAIVEG